jgi:hypothetical protein
MARETITATDPDNGEKIVTTENLLSRWGFERLIEVPEDVEPTFLKRMGLASRLATLEAAQSIEVILMDQLGRKFPEMGEDARDRVVTSLRDTSKKYNPGFVPNFGKGCLWPLLVYPREKISTNQMAMKNAKFGKAVFNFLEPDQVKKGLFGANKIKFERARENYVISPVGILSYPFECSAYSNKRDLIGGWMSHIVIQTIKKVPKANVPSLMLSKVFINDRWFDLRSQGILGITERDNNLSATIAKLVEPTEVEN